MHIEDYVEAQLSAVRKNMYVAKLMAEDNYNNEQKLYDYQITFKKTIDNRGSRSTQKRINARVTFNIRVLVDSEGEIIRSKILNERGVEIPVITDRIIEEYFENKTIPISDSYLMAPKVRRSY